MLPYRVSEKRRKKLDKKIILEQIIDDDWGPSLDEDDAFLQYVGSPSELDFDQWAFLEGALPNPGLTPKQVRQVYLAQAAGPRRSESVARLFLESTNPRFLEAALYAVSQLDRVAVYRTELIALVGREGIPAFIRDDAEDLLSW